MSEVNIGLIGSGIMGKAYSVALRMIQAFFGGEMTEVCIKVLSTTREDAGRGTARDLGIEEWTADWREIAGREDIHAVIVATPDYLHKEMVVEAARNGKHVFCEKPMTVSAAEAQEMYDAAEEAGVIHMVNFNYRKTPAVLLIRKWIDEGKLGDIHSCGFSYLQDWGADRNLSLGWRFQKKYSGAGSIADIGSHVIDMARFLVGEFSEVVGVTSTKIMERPIGGLGFGETAKDGDRQTGVVDVDDLCSVLCTFENGAKGTIATNRIAIGRKNHFTFEISGMKGSVYFDWENRNDVYLATDDTQSDRAGFTRVIVGETTHPYSDHLWALAGLGIGYAEPIALQFYEFIRGILNKSQVSPNLYDGLKNNRVIDAVVTSLDTRRFVKV